MHTRPIHPESPTRRRGFTLAEILVAVALILALTGIFLFSTRAIGDSQKRATAKQQLALISHAVDQYASFWPKWKAAGVVIAEKGWPDFVPARLFSPTAFETISGFNDTFGFDVDDGIVRPNPPDRNPDFVGVGDVLSANICLAYALTTASGEGPFLPEDDQALLKDITDPTLLQAFRKTGDAAAILADPLLPAYLGETGAKHAQVLVDPWGTPYRYFWVYRDPNAYRGFLPVDYGPYLFGAGEGGVNHPSYLLPDGTRKTGHGFVLESAGPDLKFGNTWQLAAAIGGSNDPDVTEAEDNLVIRP